MSAASLGFVALLVSCGRPPADAVPASPPTSVEMVVPQAGENSVLPPTTQSVPPSAVIALGGGQVYVRPAPAEIKPRTDVAVARRNLMERGDRVPGGTHGERLGLYTSKASGDTDRLVWVFTTDGVTCAPAAGPGAGAGAQGTGCNLTSFVDASTGQLIGTWTNGR